MSKRAEEFMDDWLDTNVAPRRVKSPMKAVPVLTRKCAAGAKKAGVPLDELEDAVVVDLEEAIVDELSVAAPKPIRDNRLSR